MKIHISQTTKETLDNIGGYETQFRGKMDISVSMIKFLLNCIFFLLTTTAFLLHVVPVWTKIAAEARNVTSENE